MQPGSGKTVLFTVIPDAWRKTWDPGFQLITCSNSDLRAAAGTHSDAQAILPSSTKPSGRPAANGAARRAASLERPHPAGAPRCPELRRQVPGPRRLGADRRRPQTEADVARGPTLPPASGPLLRRVDVPPPRQGATLGHHRPAAPGRGTCQEHPAGGAAERLGSGSPWRAQDLPEHGHLHRRAGNDVETVEMPLVGHIPEP